MDMQMVGTVTSQGQLTIPASFRALLGLETPAKVEMELLDDGFIVRPKSDFWSLGGSLKSSVSLSEADLRKARMAFGPLWASGLAV